MSKDIYIVYETTSLVNGKFYIGVHKINGRRYLGSGKILKRAIRKYGRSNFFRETLKSFSNEQDAYDYECSIVDYKLINNTYCYNVINGGGLPPKTSFWSNKKFTKDHKIKLRNKPNSKICIINGKYFNSFADAGRFFSVTKQTISEWCRTKIPHCYSI